MSLAAKASSSSLTSAIKVETMDKEAPSSSPSSLSFPGLRVRIPSFTREEELSNQVTRSESSEPQAKHSASTGEYVERWRFDSLCTEVKELRHQVAQLTRTLEEIAASGGSITNLPTPRAHGPASSKSSNSSTASLSAVAFGTTSSTPRAASGATGATGSAAAVVTATTAIAVGGATTPTALASLNSRGLASSSFPNLLPRDRELSQPLLTPTGQEAFPSARTPTSSGLLTPLLGMYDKKSPASCYQLPPIQVNSSGISSHPSPFPSCPTLTPLGSKSCEESMRNFIDNWDFYTRSDHAQTQTQNQNANLNTSASTTTGTNSTTASDTNANNSNANSSSSIRVASAPAAASSQQQQQQQPPPPLPSPRHPQFTTNATNSLGLNGTNNPSVSVDFRRSSSAPVAVVQAIQQQQQLPTTSSNKPQSFLKRNRSDTSGSFSGVSFDVAGGNAGADGTVNAARQLYRLASEVRHELLQCIISRIIGFVRIHRESTGVQAVVEAIDSDIKDKLRQVTSSDTSDPSICKYRVEILKFITRELPRSVHESVEKRLPQELKKVLNRSLVALLVQKAHGALEQQMHLENARDSKKLKTEAAAARSLVASS